MVNRPPTDPDDRLSRALDALDDRFYVLDSEGRVVHVNEPARTAVGATGDELLSTHVAECFADGHRERIEAVLSTAREEGFGHDRLTTTPADGETDTHEFRVWKPPDDEADVGFVGIVRDVTERAEHERILTDLHRSTRKLMTAETRTAAAEIAVETLSSLLSLPHAGIHFVGDRGECLVPVAWTEYAERTIGKPPDLGPGSLAWDVFESGEASQYPDLDAVENPHNRETVLASELIIPLGDHGVAIVASTERAAFDDDDQRLAQVLCSNLTAALDRIVHAERLRRNEQKLARENERLDEFAGVVSHDLRNPLNVALGRIDLLREDCDSDHIPPLERALDRMETIIEDVLALAHEGKRVDEIEPVDLDAVVGRARTNTTADADVAVRIEDDVTVYADESRLVQVFENLLRNAAEHGATDGGVTVTVGALPDGFYLEDDGPGIPPEKREQVLEAGYSTTRDGTGFGLSIVRDIVEAHGWELAVTGGADGGARFEFTGVETA